MFKLWWYELGDGKKQWISTTFKCLKKKLDLDSKNGLWVAVNGLVYHVFTQKQKWQIVQCIYVDLALN